MNNTQLLLSDKYKSFLKCRAPVEFMEGTTAAGKTTAGILKFMLKAAGSPKRLHIISGQDTGTVEKNIINKELGILDIFSGIVEYNGNGSKADKIPHLLFRTSSGDKIIYNLGYGDKTKWKKALGGQYGCLLIDEINTADIEFVREAAMRCDYMLGTLNPDDPKLPVYKEYINSSRPLPEWERDTPAEIIRMLNQEPKPGWVHWFFSFSDNAGLPPEKIKQIKTNTPTGTKLWKNKILGLRGRASGLVFPNFQYQTCVLPEREIKSRQQSGIIQFQTYTAGLDTSYSGSSPDTIAMIFQGITEDRRLIVLAERIYSNRELSQPLAPSDTVMNLIEFLERNRKKWGFARDVFVDSADQATMMELAKYKRLNGSIYNFINAYKKIQIIDRIKLQLSWLQTGCYLVSESCPEHIRELSAYSWQPEKDNEPEDRNDHTINASQYGWLPYRMRIGGTEEEQR